MIQKTTMVLKLKTKTVTDVIALVYSNKQVFLYSGVCRRSLGLDHFKTSNTQCLMNEVNQRRARLVLGWVNVGPSAGG